MQKLVIKPGDRYTRWVIVSEATTSNRMRRFNCKCDCGVERAVQLTHLRQGTSKSCGCLAVEVSTRKATIHGFGYNPLHQVWLDMLRRCLNPKHARFKDWGGRGITVCSEWMVFEQFLAWGEFNGYKVGLLIERIKNDEGYSPTNCRWATMKEQGNNRRNNRLITYNGKTMTLSQWADRLDISASALDWRLSNWDLQRALKTPVNLKISKSLKGRKVKNGG